MTDKHAPPPPTPLQHDGTDRRAAVVACCEALQLLVARPALLAQRRAVAMRLCALALDCVGTGSPAQAAWLAALQQSLQCSDRCAALAPAAVRAARQTALALWNLVRCADARRDLATSQAAYALLVRQAPVVGRLSVTPLLGDGASRQIPAMYRVIVIQHSLGVSLETFGLTCRRTVSVLRCDVCHGVHGCTQRGQPRRAWGAGGGVDSCSGQRRHGQVRIEGREGKGGGVGEEGEKEHLRSLTISVASMLQRMNTYLSPLTAALGTVAEV